jgi:hypothetical protein
MRWEWASQNHEENKEYSTHIKPIVPLGIMPQAHLVLDSEVFSSLSLGLGNQILFA